MYNDCFYGMKSYRYSSKGQNTFPFDFSDKSSLFNGFMIFGHGEIQKMGRQFFKYHLWYFTDQNGSASKITNSVISHRKVFHIKYFSLKSEMKVDMINSEPSKVNYFVSNPIFGNLQTRLYNTIFSMLFSLNISYNRLKDDSITNSFKVSPVSIKCLVWVI